MVFTDLEQLISFSKRLSILYLEDNKEAAQATLDLLKNFFDDIDIAENGEVGLDYLKQKRYDLIFADIHMPKMDGITFCKEALAHDKSLHIVIISAHNDSKHYFEALQVGVDGYIAKPINLKNFKSTIQNVIEKIYHHHQSKQRESNLKKQLFEKSTHDKLRDIELEFTSYHDDLTGITNLLKLQNDLLIFENTDFLLIDIDDFSHINSVYGTKVGDLLLQEFALILQEFAVIHAYTLYRVGGDHFALLRYGSIDVDSVRFAQMIVEYFSTNSVKLHKLDSFLELNIGVTIGISQNHFGHVIMEQATEALKYAQKNAKSLMLFDQSLGIQERNKKAFDAVGLVKNALASQNLIPYYQPILKDGVYAYECLVRIKAGKQIINPGEFLDDIYQTSLYNKLTYSMIEQSFAYFSDKKCAFSINLSYKDIDNPNFWAWLTEKALEYGVGKQLIIEFVESEYLNSFELVHRFINTMRQIGAAFAIDDFGSGYSNFTYLLKIKPDFLKIDGSLIKDIDTNPQSYAIVKAITTFAKDLQIQTIAEFTHSKEVYACAKSLGIDGFQGYYIGKPQQDIGEFHV
ncbi:MAG: EAL domain-containing protein [Campylobacterota bacterium]